ncbi:ORF6N domain-containing protein [candidate division KSB1 bacterium]|nr:ORF6N domain-containing protein [candidate division KSB1 bacterium]
MPLEQIKQTILVIKKKKVIIDSDLALIYGTSTKHLNQSVRRNSGRFPADFVFQLTADEKNEVVTNCDHLGKLKYSSYLPFAFTEHGALMAASVLNTDHAIQVSVFVIRAFVKLREIASTHKEMENKLTELENRVGKHDKAILQLIEAIKQLMKPPEKARRKIGF